LKIEFFIGGISLDIDVIKCKGCHIAIGAPGRIKHLINLGELKVQEVRLLVLDEVDVLVNNKEFAIG
jgi:ATP-dependent RNA helicase DDX20